MNANLVERLSQLLALVEKEDYHLQGVRSRLAGSQCQVTEAQLARMLESDIGIDRLESFGAKFARMQDTMADKLIPTVLQAAGEPVAAAIDNLARMERLQLLHSADEWLAMRTMRNQLVHEYVGNTEELAPAITKACQFAEQMHADFECIRRFVVQRLLPPECE